MVLFPEGVPVSKRLLDIFLTIPGIILISPLVLVVALFVWVFHGLPIIFRQERGGYRGTKFAVYKFRTMADTRNAEGVLLPDDLRLTHFGRFLRSTSLDELPEVLNVLKGEMSLVGPRPLFASYLDRYNPEQAHRHDVLPGMTGWVQVNGRNALTWEDKFRLDIWYVDHWSFWLDIKILLLTFWKVLKREGITQPGQATMEEFTGDQGEQV